MTPRWSPVNAQESRNSGEHLTTWTRLSGKFDETLRTHETTLNELSERLRTSEANGKRLTGLFDELSRQNDDLRNYNSQIGERMRERDEDLAWAYDRIDKLEKRLRKAVITIILMAVLILGAIVLTVARALKIVPI
jgi:chromosome segregation ATPase